MPMKVALMTHAGGAHMSAYLSALANADSCNEVVLADPDQRWVEPARKALGGKLTRAYRSHDELLRKETPGFSLVSMEAAAAPRVIDASLSSGSHVFSEKPGCVSIDQFERLANLAESKHLHLMMAFANRANPETSAARQLIRQQRIGDIFSVDLHIVADQTRLTRKSYHTAWYADRKRSGGGHLIWLGIHWLDLAMYVTGTRITEVTGAIANVGGQPIRIEDSAVATLRFDNGTLGTINSGYYLDRGYHTQIRIWGSKGWLNLDSTGPNKLSWYETTGPKAKQIRTFEDPVEPRGYSPFVARCISAIANGTDPPITTQESLATLRAVYGIYAAAEQGRAVTIAPREAGLGVDMVCAPPSDQE